VNLAGWMNTEPAIIIAVQRQSGADVIATADAIKKALPQLEASLPPSLKIHIVSDRMQTIRASCNSGSTTWPPPKTSAPER
jgi:multidrug efflux pump